MPSVEYFRHRSHTDNNTDTIFTHSNNANELKTLLWLFISQQICNTSLQVKFIIFFRAICDQLPTTNKNILRSKGEIKVFFVCTTLTVCVLFGTPACRRSDQALNQHSKTKVFWRKKRQKTLRGEKNWLSHEHSSELFRESFLQILYLYVMVWLCWWTTGMYVQRFMYRRILPSLSTYIKCHSVACIGCVNGFEVEHKMYEHIFMWRVLHFFLRNRIDASNSLPFFLFIDGSF